MVENKYLTLDELNVKKIKKRIKKERKALGLTQNELAEKAGLSYNSRTRVYQWEKEADDSINGLPTLEQFLYMCKLFECDLGYLLCLYDFKTRDDFNIYKMTKLSADAINTISKINDRASHLIGILNQLIGDKEFIYLLEQIETHVWNYNEDHFPKRSNNIQIIADEMNCSIKNIKDYMETNSETMIESSFMKIIKKMKSPIQSKKLFDIESVK